MFASLLRQLLRSFGQEPWPSDVFQSLRETCDGEGALNVRDLIALFFRCSESFTTTYIILDALDECADSGLRWKVTNFCEEALKTGSRHRVLVTSRPHLSMELMTEATILHIEATPADLEGYIRETLRHTGCRFSAALRDEITASLLRLADGWYCPIQYILKSASFSRKSISSTFWTTLRRPRYDAP